MKSTVCPYCQTTFLYAGEYPRVKCCGSVLPVGGVREPRPVTVLRADNSNHPEAQKLKELKLEDYRNHWKRLHLIPHDIVEWDSKTAKRYYQDWRSSIPQSSCECPKHWTAIERKSPPVFTSADAFFQWSVDRHNDVNRKLGKPEFSIEQAKALYAPI